MMFCNNSDSVSALGKTQLRPICEPAQVLGLFSLVDLLSSAVRYNVTMIALHK